ncbi:hypothetical protein L1887_22372 [Cichorium endivia]|nr:hypothetical protein L1887_22372 [Cichorium endivia]
MPAFWWKSKPENNQNQILVLIKSKPEIIAYTLLFEGESLEGRMKKVKFKIANRQSVLIVHPLSQLPPSQQPPNPPSVKNTIECSSPNSRKIIIGMHPNDIILPQPSITNSISIQNQSVKKDEDEERGLLLNGIEQELET